ncbi:PR domain zinc finger protein 2 isoform X1 [Conger conger]|nr:PR domain zinc finger protein 2 isoform X1 [Conger conger]
MWEVYFPAWGWMCVDATDPLKGNWLRYVNWARSTQEQNLFPMEINRAIYYKVLKPIGPGEELLVWYNGEDNPEIAAALEEERTSSSIKKNSPRARRARRKLLERAKQAGVKQARDRKEPCGTGTAAAETVPTETVPAETVLAETGVTVMWEPDDGAKGEGTAPSSDQPALESAESRAPSEQEDQPSMEVTEGSAQSYIPVVVEGQEEEEEGNAEEEEAEEEEGEEQGEEEKEPTLPPEQKALYSVEVVPMDTDEPAVDPRPSGSGCEEELVIDQKWEPASNSSPSNPELDPDPEPDPDPDPDPDPEGEPQGLSSFPCQHCERHFSTKQGLERHTHIHVTANHHTHAFKCRYCGKSFGSQIGRRRHERRHENGPKKRPGSLGGTLMSHSPSLRAESSSPDLIAPSGNFIIMGSQNGAEPRERPAAEKQSSAAAIKAERTFVLDENGESKELHPCKYCKKVFGTHTNMRRHQRRIHERHLLPKGVPRKGLLLQETQPEKQPPRPAREESSNSSPPPVYVPSGEAEDEGDQEEEYMVDISSNISENLSLYIDGKILSTSSVSSCEVIEVDSSSAALFGLDAVIISPDQLSQALKVETTTCTVKEVPGQSATKRRTATPPLPPKIKTELESDPIMQSSTSLSSSSSSSSSSSMVGAIFSQPIETLAFQKEKNVYLSPKLKQLLQTHDGQKSTVALITDSHRLGPPLSVTTLPAGPGRFKRRTASPPNSPQDSPSLKVEGMKSEAGVSFTLKVPKLESHCSSPSWSMSSKDERDTMSPPGNGADAFKVSAMDWPAARSGGSSCNQQPLDLSNAVSKRSEAVSKGPGEVVLDLSMHRKPSAEPEAKGGPAPQPLIKKRKPNTSMLEKVLMNEYAGLDITGNEGPSASGSQGGPSALEPAAITDTQSLSSEEHYSESSSSSQLHPPPPSLTPVSMHPPSPCAPALGSPTPPPPVLPTVPSPLSVMISSEPRSPCSPAGSPLPVLSPETSPRRTGMCEEEGPGSPELDLSPQRSTSMPVLSSDSSCVEADSTLPGSSLNPNSCVLLPDPSVSHVALQACTVNSLAGSEGQSSSPSVALGDSSIHPLSIAHSSVVIECTVSVGAPESDVCAPLTVRESPLVVSPAGNVVILEQAIVSVQQQPLSPAPSLEPPVLVASLPETAIPPCSPAMISESPPSLVLSPPTVSLAVVKEEPRHKEELDAPPADADMIASDEESQQDGFSKSFTCNVCETPFRSIKALSHHIAQHAVEWPFKCEFCVLLFGDASALLEHRSALHGVGRIYVCSACAKEFAFLCNLQQHQKDLHPGQDCTHGEVESGKLRLQNYNNPSVAGTESSPASASGAHSDGAESAFQPSADIPKEEEEEEEEEEEDLDPSTEELYTTIKIMASEGGKPKGPDVRLGMNQHYPSFKPPPFPYHNRTPAGSVISATNFTTHNIPQTFSTAIRCTKCGNSFDNMPELHKHILACANASDKKRYTPKKNPIPLKQIAKPQNGVLSPIAAAAAAAANTGQNAFRRMGQPKRLNFAQEPTVKMKLNALNNKKKNQLVQKAISLRNKSGAGSKKDPVLVEEEQQEVHVCPHCSREFTYRGSLNKHVAVSCPMKPVSKKARKGNGRTVENNGSIRKGKVDAEVKQLGTNGGQRPLGKTRARTSGPAAGAAKLGQSSNGRMAAQPPRVKRPASFPATTVPFSKKSKTVVKGNVQVQQQQQQQQQQPQQQSSPELSPVSAAPPGGSLQRQAPMRMQRGAKEAPPKKAPEVKAPQPPHAQPKKEERFPARTRERVGGPVTRSLQQAGLVASTEAKGGEAAAGPEPAESQDVSSKLAG